MKKLSGFTLIEVIFSLAISIIVIQIIIASSIYVHKLWHNIFIENRLTNNYVDISQRIAKQTLQASHYSEITTKNIPLGKELIISDLGNNIIHVSTIKDVGNKPFNYQSYFRLGI